MRSLMRLRSNEKERTGKKASCRWLLLKREDSSHLLWINPKNGVIEAVPRHKEIKEPLANKILKNLNAQ